MAESWRDQALRLGVDQNNPSALATAGITPNQSTNVDFGPATEARQRAESAATLANQYAAGGNTLVDELRKAMGERYAQSPAAQQLATARGQFLSAAPQARADVSQLIQGGAILSPTQQQAIMASKQGAALVPVMGANLINEATFGTLQDLIGAGTNAYNARVQELQGLAGIAQTGYSNILNELIQKAQEQRSQEQLGLTKAAAGREAELFPIQKATAQAQLAKLLEPSKGREPDKYGDNEITRAAGLVGMPITTESNEKLAYQQYLANQATNKIPSGAYIKQLQQQGYNYDPNTGQFTKKEPNLIERIKQFFGGG